MSGRSTWSAAYRIRAGEKLAFIRRGPPHCTGDFYASIDANNGVWSKAKRKIELPYISFDGELDVGPTYWKSKDELKQLLMDKGYSIFDQTT